MLTPIITCPLTEIDPRDRPLLERIGRLRVRAWSTLISEATAMGIWLDGFEAAARHWVVYRGDEVIAAARLSVHHRLEDVPDPECFVGVFQEPLPTPIASFNRLVVDPSARELGISRRLDLVRLEAAEAMGCRCVIGSTPSGEKRIRQMIEIEFTVVGLGNPDLHPPCCSGPRPVVVFCPLPREARVTELPTPGISE